MIGVIVDTNNYCMYSHTNKINGKIYIGLTSMVPEERWKNGKGYQAGTHFRNAINKYGWDNFEHKIIKDNLTKDEAAYWEMYYISFYNSSDRRYGYNMSSGGENGGGHPQTEETRKKISENHVGFKGKQHKAESLKQMSASHSGENHPNYGKHLSEETKRKISETYRKNNSRKIFCVELNCIYDSIVEASEKTGCYRSGILMCCQGKYKQCKGYHFRYAN